MSDQLNKAEIEDIVEKTVIKTLGELGIDLSTPEGRKEWIEDQFYTRAWRKTVQKGARTGFLTMVTVLVTGMLGVIYVGIQVMLGGHPQP